MSIIVKNELVIDLVSEDESDDDSKDTNSVYDGGGQWSLEVKTEIVMFGRKVTHHQNKTKIAKNERKRIRMSIIDRGIT